MKSIRPEEMPIACYKLQKNDIFRVGRVRFKIRDVMSPVYRNIDHKNSLQNERHHVVFPSGNDSSSLLDEQAPQLHFNNLANEG